MSTLFISHSSRDGAAARALRDRLAAQGHRALFLDFDPETGIRAGASWERTLYTQLRACRAVVALCSDHYLASHWCFAEIALARMEGKEIFVLRIDPWSPGTKLPSILTEGQVVDLRADPDLGYERLAHGLRAKGIVPEEHREWAPGEPPYPGLRAFEERDAPIFFGRDAEIGEGLETLNRVRRQGHPRLVLVLGSSGSGKSSLARAGIVPRLRRDRDRWRIVGPLRPGRQPLRELAAAFSRAFAEAGRERPWEEILARLDPPSGAAAPPRPPPGAPPPEPSARDRLLAALRQFEGELAAGDEGVAASVRGLADLLARAPDAPPAVRPARAGAGDAPLAALVAELRLSGGAPEASVVVVVDQLEEVLGHERAGPGHPANRFLLRLREGIESDDGAPLALATMRSDFLGTFQRCPALLGVGFKSLSVGPMPREGMRQVVEQPARLGQVELERGLPELLLDETGTSDALPLLAFTLRALWDRYHGDRLLEIREFRELGSLQGAVAKVADEACAAALAHAGEADLRDAFLNLARPAAEGSGWSRRPAGWEELPERVRPALREFVDRRLLVHREDGTVEVAHEALFRSWDTLRGWLDENAEALHLLREIETDAGKWRNAAVEAEQEPYLWRGGRLARALELRSAGVLAVADPARSFLDAAEAAERARAEAAAARARRELRRARMVAAAVGAALVVALGFWRLSVAEAEKAREAARAAISRSLMYAGQATWGNLVALEVRDPLRTPTAFDALHEALADPVEQVVLRGHTDVLAGAAFSPDGARVLSASGDGTARLWDAASGREIAVLSGHAGRVGAAAWSPDGRRLATASDDGTARLWGAVAGTLVATLEGHSDGVGAISFSPDGTRLATASGDGTARLWDAAAGTPVAVLVGHGGPVRGAVFRFDGRLLVTPSGDGTARVWDAASGARLAVLSGHAGAVRGAVFSPDGARVATASADGTARIWNAAGGPPLAVLEGHDGTVETAAFSPDGARVTTTSDDGTARIWDAATGEPVAVLRGHAKPVRGAAFSGDGRRLLTASDDRTARLWDAATGAELARLRGHTEEVRSAVFSPDGALVLTAGDDTTGRIWGTERGEEIAILAGHSGGLYEVAFSPDGSRVATAADDGTARIWDAATGAALRVLAAAGGGEVRGVAFSRDGARLATASRAGTPQVWETATGAARLALEGHTAWVHSVAFSRDGGRLVTASEDGTARVWEAATGRPLAVLAGHRGRVYAATFSPDGARVVTASEDRTARTWEASTGRSLVTFTGHGKPLRWAAFSPDGGRVVTASEDHTARTWDTADGRPLAVLEGHADWVSRAVFSPDGARIATAADDDTARVWTADGEPLFRLVGHTSDVHAVAFSPDGRSLATASDDGTARIWAHPEELSVVLRGRIRARTRLCLPPEVYQALGESEAGAARAAATCARCVPAFFDVLAGAPPARWPAYADAWQAYERCLGR